MMFNDDIEALGKRLAKAVSDRDTWRAAGAEEKYLAAYFAVEALELTTRRAAAREGRPGRVSLAAEGTRHDDKPAFDQHPRHRGCRAAATQAPDGEARHQPRWPSLLVQRLPV
jgi:hypothetical protein